MGLIMVNSFLPYIRIILPKRQELDGDLYSNRAEMSFVVLLNKIDFDVFAPSSYLQ